MLSIRIRKMIGLYIWGMLHFRAYPRGRVQLQRSELIGVELYIVPTIKYTPIKHAHSDGAMKVPCVVNVRMSDSEGVRP
jgi:hypothetical protein